MRAWKREYFIFFVFLHMCVYKYTCTCIHILLNVTALINKCMQGYFIFKLSALLHAFWYETEKKNKGKEKILTVLSFSFLLKLYIYIIFFYIVVIVLVVIIIIINLVDFNA